MTDIESIDFAHLSDEDRQNAIGYRDARQRIVSLAVRQEVTDEERSAIAAVFGYVSRLEMQRDALGLDTENHRAMTVRQFEERFGFKPHPDELARVSCNRVGDEGHFMCGVCYDHNKPRSVCGCMVRATPKT